MPDEDKFERRLNGRGWRRVYRLAAGSGPVTAVVNASMTAIAHAMRNHLKCPTLREILAALQLALHQKGHKRAVQDEVGGYTDSSDPFALLLTRLDEIQDADPGHAATRLAVVAAQDAYQEFDSGDVSPESQLVHDRLAEHLAGRIVDHECLSRVRDGIVEKSGRTLEQQAAWEREFLRELAPQARRLLRRAFQSSESGVIRAPKRLTLQILTTQDQLHKPLIPLQG